MRSALILAGGRGERFWPMSRPGHPKQLLPLADGKVLLTATLERLDGIVDPERTIVLTSAELAGRVGRLVGERARVVAEPVGRNTAPAAGLAAHLALALGAEDAMVVLPADHLITDVEAFRKDLRAACALAEARDVLVTFGVRPDRPETGYGYIECGPAIEDGDGPKACVVQKFKEKPDRETAEFYLGSEDFLWNSGIFTWRPRVLLAALEKHRPELAAGILPLSGPPAAQWAEGKGGALTRALAAHFPGLEAISVDYAIMEEADNAAMIEASFPWDDLGSWGSWARRQRRDERGNVVEDRALVVDSDDCVVLGGGERPVVVLGGRGLVVIQHEGGTLICPADRADEVRKAVSALEAKGWLEDGSKS